MKIYVDYCNLWLEMKDQYPKEIKILDFLFDGGIGIIILNFGFAIIWE